MKHDHHLGDRFSTSSKSRRGSAVVMATIAIATLMMLSLAFFQVSRASSNEILEQVDQRAAFHLADAGVGEAIEALRSGSTGNVGKLKTPAFMSNGVFWVEATDLGAGQTRLLVTALKGSGRAAIEVIVEVDAGEGPMFAGMMLSKDEIMLASTATVDSFDSGLGTYASQAVNTYNGYTYAGSKGHIKSSADIDVHSNAGVFGDANAGQGFSTTLSSGAFVMGSTTPASDLLAVPSVVAPAVPPAGSLTVTGSTTLPSGDYGFDSLVIDEGLLTIIGPATIVIQDFDTVGKASDPPELVIDATDGPVTIYTVNSFSYDKDFEVSGAPGSPLDLVWMFDPDCGNGHLNFGNGAKLVGGVYAPDHIIHFNNGCTVQGAFVVQDVKMMNGVEFHFDEYLFARTVQSGGSGSPEVNIVSWNTVALPAELPVGDRRDPFLMLGLDRKNLPKPADAWDMP